jgi:hypothetical protein
MDAFEWYQVLSKLGYHIDTRSSLCLATVGTFVCLGQFHTFAQAVDACVTDWNMKNSEERN